MKDRDQISYCGWKMACGTRLIKFYELCRERGEREGEGEGLNCVWLSIRYGFLYIPPLFAHMHANACKNDGPSFVTNESFVLNKTVRLSKEKNVVFNLIFFNLW